MLNVILSETAVTKLRDLIGQHGTADTTYLRIYIAGGGCSGFKYGMALDNKLHEGDEVVDANGIKVVVDKKSYLSLNGTKLDYVTQGLTGGFTFVNPQAKSSCGCGTSFSA
jgi:iron-sulfur cluster assembly accessory protein